MPAAFDTPQLARVLTLIISLIFIAIALISITHTPGTLRRPLNIVVRVAVLIAADFWLDQKADNRLG
jgi:hypothetical protein